MSEPPCAGLDDIPVQDFFATGQASWPTLGVDRPAFERHLRAVSRLGPPQVRYAADLYLACACALGVDGAIAAFEAHFARTLASAISRIDGSAEFVDDAAQALRIKLFVRAPPKIASYGGRAKLSTWLTTLAARGAMDHLAARGPAAERPSLVDRIEAAVSPELDYVRARYKGQIEGAVVAALARLTQRERGLLRLHLGERMSIDHLAVAYRVGRSTAARWLAGARGSLLAQTEREMRERLGVTASEIRDLGQALRSELDVSLVRLLRSSRS